MVSFSGDKLLGGPQAGVIAGKKDLVGRIRRNPLFRALRVDKITYAILGSTFRAYRQEQYDRIPALRMIRMAAAEVELRARQLMEQVAPRKGASSGMWLLGNRWRRGSAGRYHSTRLIALRHASRRAAALEKMLLAQDPPVVAASSRCRLARYAHRPARAGGVSCGRASRAGVASAVVHVFAVRIDSAGIHLFPRTRGFLHGRCASICRSAIRRE